MNEAWIAARQSPVERTVMHYFSYGVSPYISSISGRSVK